MSLIACWMPTLSGADASHNPPGKYPIALTKHQRTGGALLGKQSQDRTMHAYKSCAPEQLLNTAAQAATGMHANQPAN